MEMLGKNVEALKLQARDAYRRFRVLTADLDCGTALACEIRPDVERARREFNETYARLEQLDPTAPPGFRL